MVSFPNCKINLGLRILRKRGDGFHDLDTLFYPLPFKDVLEIIRSERTAFTATGIPIPGDGTNNLCLRAYNLLSTDFPDLPPVDIHLHKQIPTGAGLGGGSADGAGMLHLLNKSFHLGLSTERQLDYAAELGSDCPFFILNTPCIGSGRGETLKPVALDLSSWSFLLVHPGIHISTPWAFAQCTPGEGGKPVEEIIRLPVCDWAGQLVNDFEEPVLSQYPVLRSVRDQLYAAGAVYASLTGSGSCFFGIFEKGRCPSLTFAPDFRVFTLT